MRTVIVGVALALGSTGCHVGFLGLALSGIGHGVYDRGDLAKKLGKDSVRTVGCVEVGLVRFERVEADQTAALLDLHIGNGCSRSTTFDLKRMRILARGAHDTSASVVINDPRSEIVPLEIGGKELGQERLRMLIGGVLEPVERLTFELDTVVPDTRLPDGRRAPRPAPLCFERREERWLPADCGDA